ncbi:MAG TPA: mechanosensitive ion channel protein MscS [Firmicutes bacterium]|jgi:miniconductance mechanosensitive channel|nr:mechanosensitive ion channel protein MscS [Bacillota bacterium]
MEFLEIPIVRDILILVFALAISAVAFRLVRTYLLEWLYRLFRKTPTKWDDFVIEAGVFKTFAMVIPGIIMFRATPFLQVIADPVNQLLKVLVIFVLAVTLDRLMKAGLKIYGTFRISDRMPIKGFVQILQIAMWVFAGTAIFSLLLGQSPWALLGGLGALSAVLILVFQDTILSFFAGIQLTLNDQVRVGDWIEAPKFGADGDVVEVALHYVKVRNWDRSITTIPTHKLAQDSFVNWRGMFEGGGRRIKRSILIDQTSVRFLDQELFEHLSDIELLQDYLSSKMKEIAEYNRVHNIQASVVNGRHLTNLGTFRAYLVAYLRAHPAINQNLIMIVRQLAPTPNGLPMEIYAFTKDVGWVNHEGVAADVFDHVLAIVSEFDLRVFQAPGGHDLARLVRERSL